MVFCNGLMSQPMCVSGSFCVAKHRWKQWIYQTCDWKSYGQQAKEVQFANPGVSDQYMTLVYFKVFAIKHTMCNYINPVTFAQFLIKDYCNINCNFMQMNKLVNSNKLKLIKLNQRHHYETSAK